MTENSPNNNKKFYCEVCDYKCSKLSDYTKHLLTSKHKNSYNLSQNSDVFSPALAKKYICDCGKEYKYRQGLFTHRKTCEISYNNENNDNNDKNVEDKDNILKNIVLDVIKQTNESNSKSNNELIQYLINENKEFKNLILEIVKKDSSVINNTNNNNINNCNNQSFNLNFFLNEQCKDAMNIDEFVDSIKMNLSDLENFAHLGYADGVSNIFAKGIKELGVHMRPIHCSDSKRETLYIKNNDEWIKETDDKPLITKAIKKVAFKNIKQINEWVKENPSCKDPRTKKFDQYNKIVMNSMSGVTEEEQKNNIEKIVKNVTKSVAIEKYALQ